MKSTGRLVVLVLLIMGCSIRLPSQSTDSITTEGATLTLFEFLYQQQDSLPFLHLDTDWGQLIRNKMKEEYQPGVLSFRHMDGSQATLEVKVRARGNIRKQVCYYPPIKIKAKKKQLKALGFKPINDFKLALPCRAGKNHEDCIAREALAYHIYEAVHPIHIKARIVRLEAIEDDKQQHLFTALLVEDEEEFSARLNAKIVGKGVLRTSALERDSYLKMCFFQYMIANTDWAIANRHNMEMLIIPGIDRVVPVPYDFDYSGFSGTYYAVPYPSLPINDVDQRYFMGRKVTEEEALETSKFFLSKKEEILQKCTTLGGFDEKEVASLHRYLSKFFDLLENEKKVRRIFVVAE